MHIALAQINPTIGAVKENTDKVLQSMEDARVKGAELLLLPELALCGYPPEDFLFLDPFIDACEEQLQRVVEASEGLAVIVGLPRRHHQGSEKALCNAAAVIDDGKLLGFYDKCLLPTYDVFDERRYFEAGTKVPLWTLKGQKVAVLICEDLWQHAGLVNEVQYGLDPVQALRAESPDMILNLSASPYHLDKQRYRLQTCQKVAQSVGCPVLLCNQVGGNDSLIFDGHSLHVDAKGQLVQRCSGFEEALVISESSAEGLMQVPEKDEDAELFHALVLGLRDYFRKLGFKKACLGLSGGIDSALVACIAAEALGADNVLALSMPSRYSSEHSLSDAAALAKNLAIHYDVIEIEGLFQNYLALTEAQFPGREADETEENLQARIRGMILMAYSNKEGYIVLSPGNKSEIALGYCTLYGDTCGGLGVINDVVKTRVYSLARWINREKELIPTHIIEKPPSAELRPDQRDSDSLPDYAIVDTVLIDYVEKHLSPQEIARIHGFPLDLVEGLVRKIHFNEYKRVQMPPGLRVTAKAFSVGRRFPIVQRWVK
jgi:NAD+ synthase (glutamine-hydrolysing)